MHGNFISSFYETEGRSGHGVVAPAYNLSTLGAKVGGLCKSRSSSLGRKVRVNFFVLAVFQMPFTQNSQYARAAYFGVACS